MEPKYLRHKLTPSGPEIIYPYTIEQFREDFPQTGINLAGYTLGQLGESNLTEFNVWKVKPMEEMPEATEFHEEVVERTPRFIENVGWEEFWELVPLTGQELQDKIDAHTAAFAAQVQHRLDTFAQTRNYDNILSACTYANSSVPKFAAEGAYCVAKRDETWELMYQILDDAVNELRPIPMEFEDIEDELPELVWPV